MYDDDAAITTTDPGSDQPTHQLDNAVYAVTNEFDFTVSDITINGEPIVSPSQIAEHITVKISGLAHNIGVSAPVAQPCGADDDAGLESLGDQAPPSMAELLDASRRYRG